MLVAPNSLPPPQVFFLARGVSCDFRVLPRLCHQDLETRCFLWETLTKFSAPSRLGSSCPTETMVTLSVMLAWRDRPYVNCYPQQTITTCSWDLAVLLSSPLTSSVVSSTLCFSKVRGRMLCAWVEAKHFVLACSERHTLRTEPRSKHKFLSASYILLLILCI